MQSYVCWYCSSCFSVSASVQQSTKQWLELRNRVYISSWMGSSCSTNSNILIFHIPYVAVLTSVCSEAGERSPVYFSLIIVSVSVSRLMEEGIMKVSKYCGVETGTQPSKPHESWFLLSSYWNDIGHKVVLQKCKPCRLSFLVPPLMASQVQNGTALK